MLVDFGNDIVAVGEVAVAASTSCLAFSCELALEADFVSRRVLGGGVVSRASPLGLEVSDGLVALGEGRLPTSQEASIWIGVLPLVLRRREHATATSTSSATADARDFGDRPQLHNLSLDDLHPLVGDPWEAVIGLGLHGLENAREVGRGNNSGDWSGPGEAQPALDLALVRQHGPDGDEQAFFLVGRKDTLQVLDERAYNLHRVKEGSVQDMSFSEVDTAEEAEAPQLVRGLEVGLGEASIFGLELQSIREGDRSSGLDRCLPFG